MKNNLNDILTEVLVFPYDETTITSISEACSTYVEEISLEEYEACVLHLCLDIPATSFMQSINESTGHSFPTQVYRALAGHVAGLALSTDQQGVDKILYPLALRNVLKCHQPGSEGIINKCIDASHFNTIEGYWQKKASIPAIEPSDLLTNLYDKDSWADTSLEIDEQFEYIKSLAKYYCRAEFEKDFASKTLQRNQDAYAFMYEAVMNMTSRDWLYAAEEPVKVLKNLGVGGGAATLSTVKSRLGAHEVDTGTDIEKTSVFRRFIFANDYPAIRHQRISPLYFGIAVFYELLYECLKSENYE